jgi:hypothetical protein
MLRVRRIEHRTEITHAERSVVLIETNWLLLAGRGDKVGGISYQGPVAVEGDGTKIRIWDYSMIVRVAAFALIAALTIGSHRRERR